MIHAAKWTDADESEFAEIRTLLQDIASHTVQFRIDENTFHVEYRGEDDRTLGKEERICEEGHDVLESEHSEPVRIVLLEET